MNWIDVNKRTPKVEDILRSELVLVIIGDTGHTPVVGPVAGYRQPRKPRVNVGYLQEITNGTKVWMNQLGNLIEGQPWMVTHWQPLPDPQTSPTSGDDWTVFGYKAGKRSEATSGVDVGEIGYDAGKIIEPSEEPNKNILKLWLEFVKNDKHPWVEAGGYHDCYFCGATFPEHNNDCILRLTEEYLHPSA